MRIDTHGARGVACLLLLGCLAAASGVSAAPGDRTTRSPSVLRTEGGTQSSAAVRSDGELVVVWVTANGIEAQRYLSNRSPDGPVQLIAPAPDARFKYVEPQVSIGNDGGFVVAWLKTPVSFNDDRSLAVIEARVWANGPRSEIITVSTPSTYPMTEPSVARDPDNGRFAIAWTAPDPVRTQQTAYLRVFYGGGNPLGAPFRLNSPPGGASRSTRVRVALSNDVIVAAWSQGQALSVEWSWSLRAKFLTREGVAIGNAFTVARTSDDVGAIRPFELAIGYNNDVVIAYPRMVHSSDMEWGTGLYARRYALAASPQARGGEFQVSSQLTSLDFDVDVDTFGNMAFAWSEPDYLHSDLTYLHTRLYRPGGVAVTNDERFHFNNVGNHAPHYLNVGLYDAGEFLVTFSAESSSGTFAGATFAQAFAGPRDTRVSCLRYIATIVGSPGNDRLMGLRSDDVINGLGGNDRVNGYGGADVICGGGGADILYGDWGKDELDGGPGDDVLDGGDGYDTCNGGSQTNADSAVQCEGVSNVP
jgi:hypothetical protein